jgi:F0F1-type ATP synthase assembly protein I
MNNLYLGVMKVVPLVMGNALTTFKQNSQEVITIVAGVIVGATLVGLLAKAKKIKALGYIVFAALVLAVIADVNAVTGYLKSVVNFFFGTRW